MAHVGLALLYALLIFLCAKLLMRFSVSPVAIGIGILIFAIDDIHAYSSGVIMALNTILCCVFGLYALLMHDKWRRDKSGSGRARRRSNARSRRLGKRYGWLRRHSDDYLHRHPLRVNRNGVSDLRAEPQGNKWTRLVYFLER